MNKRREVQCTPEAAEYWQWLYNAIEAEIRPGGRFDKAGDHASKLADNILRVSALLHMFERGEGDITLETLEAATNICFYCSDHFIQLFVPPPQELRDATDLNAWLDRYRSTGRRYVPKAYIQRHVHNWLRDINRLSGALGLLAAQGFIGFTYIGRTYCVDLIPMVPPDPVAAEFVLQGQRGKDAKSPL